jgi:F0F1-type ATP synthase assembly protein I
MADDRGRLGRAYSIGFEFAAAVAGSVLLGYAVDWYYETSPWGIVVGAGIGIVGGMYNMIRQALAVAKEQSEEAGSKGSKRGPRG